MALSPAFPGHALCCAFLAVCWTKEFALGTWFGFCSKSWGLCLHPDLCRLLLACRNILGFFSSLFPFLPQLHRSNWFLLFPICHWFFSGNTETLSMYFLFHFEVTLRIVKHFFSWIVVLGMVIPFLSEVHSIISTNKMSGRQSFVSNNQFDKVQINSCTKKVLNCENHP